MGLVDYSESDASSSESEGPARVTTKPAQVNAKKPFQKVVDRSNPGKIVVNLPQVSALTDSNPSSNGDEPPAKRARTGGDKLFSSFNSFLPAPKNTGGARSFPKPTSFHLPPPGVNLKTSSTPGFSRDRMDADGGGVDLSSTKRDPEPSIPEDQKPASEVKVTGKPLMFKPLSVSRNNKKKSTTTAKPKTPIATSSTLKQTPISGETKGESAESNSASQTKKISLFSMHTEESDPVDATDLEMTYQPLFDDSADTGVTSNYEDYAAAYKQEETAATILPSGESLGSIANDLNLSASERRALFGRGGDVGQSAQKVINFNMDQEYRHNESIRSNGDQQIHNPVRSIQGGGKHNLRQLVQNVQNQREALEDSFAKGKNNRSEASGKYGW